MRIPVLECSEKQASIEAALRAMEQSVPPQAGAIIGHGIRTDFALPQ